MPKSDTQSAHKSAPGAGVGGRDAEGPEVQPASLAREPGLFDFKKHVAGDLGWVALFIV